MSSMKLLSAKKRGTKSNSSVASSESSSRKHKQPPLPKHSQQKQLQQSECFPSSSSADGAELLQLRLENSDLRTRLEEALSHTDESKAELLQLLEEETTQSNLLQRRCDELHRGFVEIDQERRALRKSADDARSEARQQVEQTREECERRRGQSEQHLKMREKEVEAMAERIREQERRIETVAAESDKRQSKVEELEGELEELIGMVENDREAMRGLKTDHTQVVATLRERNGQLEKAKLAEEDLERQLGETRQALQEEGRKRDLKEDQLAKDLREKDAELANLLQDRQLSKIEHEQAIQALDDEMERQKTDFESQQRANSREYEDTIAAIRSELQDARSLHEQEVSAALMLHDENAQSILALQSQLDAKSATINQLQSNHASKVAEMETIIQESKEGTRAIEKTHHELLEFNSQLQQELHELRSSTHIAHEDLKASNCMLEKENGEMAEDLDKSKTQLAATSEKLASTRAECVALQQQLDGTKDQLTDTSQKIDAFLSEHEALQSERTALQQSNSQLKEGLHQAKVELAETSDELSGVRADYASLQRQQSVLEQHISILENDIERTKVDREEALTQTSNKMASLECDLNEEKDLRRKLQVQVEENTLAYQEEAAKLTQQLESVRKDLSKKENEVGDQNQKLSSFRHECKTMLQKHASLEEELDGTKGQLFDANKELASIRSQHEMLQTEYESLREGNTRLEQHIEKQVSDAENKLDKEIRVSNKLRSQLREINLQLKEDALVHQKDMRTLERKLEVAGNDLSAKMKEVDDLETRLQALQTDHTAQMMDIETRGADVVSDLEDAIAELEKELASSKSNQEKLVAKMQKDMQTAVGIAKSEKERAEQKVTDLTSYANKRKEEVKTVKNELLRVKHSLEISSEEHEDAMTAIRASHQKEIIDLQRLLDDVRSELSTTKERFTSEDRELERLKATLSERTNLLRDMVNQTTAYQGDYQREHSRAKQLEEAVKGYKKQLAEEKCAAQRLEREIHQKDVHYCDAIRNERQQRKAMESELNSSSKSLKEVQRKNTEMEKEVLTLRDKITRQQKCIGRLQERGKSRQSTATFQTHRGLRPKIARPSTADACRSSNEGPLVKNRHTGHHVANENDVPNIEQLGLPGTPLPESSDSLR